MEALSRQKGCTPSQLALAWLLALGKDIIPIPGTSSLERLEENCAAVGVTLSAADLQQIDSMAPKGIAKGDRYAPAMQSLLNG